MSSSAANIRTGLALAGICTGIYFYTMHHMKGIAPGNLDNMVPLPPSEEARRKYEALKSKTETENSTTPTNP